MLDLDYQTGRIALLKSATDYTAIFVEDNTKCILTPPYSGFIDSTDAKHLTISVVCGTKELKYNDEMFHELVTCSMASKLVDAINDLEYKYICMPLGYSDGALCYTAQSAAVGVRGTFQYNLRLGEEVLSFDIYLIRLRRFME